VSIERSKCLAWKSVDVSRVGLTGTGGTTDSSMAGPPTASHSFNLAIASSSETFAGTTLSGTTD
jgi:hypothetical protein